MRNFLSITKRELAGYFATPLGYIFIAVFLLLAGFFTFQLGGFYERGQADLGGFFALHPWLYVFLIPAIAMRLWAEERKTGTIELLITLPVTLPQIVIGKFVAAWIFAGVALALTFPTWITVNYLGDPDNGAIFAGYAGSFLMAGGFLAIGSCISATTKNQVIAFVITITVCLFFLLIGWGPVIKGISGVCPDFLVEVIASFSFQTHFMAISKGVIEARDLVFFFSLIAFFLFANGLILDNKKAD